MNTPDHYTENSDRCEYNLCAGQQVKSRIDVFLDYTLIFIITLLLLVMLTEDPVFPYQLPTQPHSILPQSFQPKKESTQRSPNFISCTTNAPAEEAGTGVLLQAETQSLLWVPQNRASAAETQGETGWALKQMFDSGLSTCLCSVCALPVGVPKGDTKSLHCFCRNITDW